MRAIHWPTHPHLLAALLLHPACSNYLLEQDQSAELSGAGACEGLPEWTPEARLIEDLVRERIDEERRRGGRCGDWTFPPRPPLARSSELDCAAKRHALDMAERAYISPIDPDGYDLGDRLGDVGYRYSLWAETVGAGWSDADAAVDAWLLAPAHCYKLFAAEFEQIGVGVHLIPEPLEPAPRRAPHPIRTPPPRSPTPAPGRSCSPPPDHHLPPRTAPAPPRI
jgi:hypothetical protein